MNAMKSVNSLIYANNTTQTDSDFDKRNLRKGIVDSAISTSSISERGIVDSLISTSAISERTSLILRFRQAQSPKEHR